MSIADRSLSRLRGSPLPGAGCLGPGSYVGCIVLPDAVVQVLRLALARLFCRALLRRLWPPVRFGGGCAAWDWTGCVAVVSRWMRLLCRVLLRRLRRRALLGWLCPYNLGEHCTAPADMLRLHGTLPASFPLINNRPLSERAAGASRRGSGGAQTFPYGCAATGPLILGLWHGKAYGIRAFFADLALQEGVSVLTAFARAFPKCTYL